MKHITCLSLVVIYLVHKIASDTRHCRHGRIIPGRPYFMEKDDLTLECWRNSSTGDLGNLTFITGQGRKEKVFDDKYIVYSNSTYAKLTIPSISRKQVRRYGQMKFVACRDSTKTSLCMDNVYVRLEYYPRKVRNAECISKNFETLICSWSQKVQYKYKEYIKITCHVQFLMSSHQKIHQSNWVPCPNNSETSYYWNEDELSSVGYFAKVGVQISVVNTKRNISAIVTKVFHRDDIVKPAPVRNLTYTSTVDPTCIWLSWQQDWSGRTFRNNITLQSDCGPERARMRSKVLSLKQVIQTECSQLNCSQKICGINPYSVYNVSCRTRYLLNGEEKGFCSDSVYLQFTSRKTAPYNSPSVTDGLYVYEPKTLSLFWKPLDECERHSNDTAYVLFNDIFHRTVSSDIFQTVLNIEDVQGKSDSFNIKIQAENRFGTSKTSSVLEINRQIDVPKDSELIIKYKREVDGTAPEYRATIMADATNFVNYENLTHTLTWCKKDSVDVSRCKDYITWSEVDVNISSEIVPVENPRQMYKFGLITKGTNKITTKMAATDINFVECIYGYNVAPHKPLPVVRLSDVISPHRLTVEWEKFKCRGPEFSVPFIENYVLMYCIADEPEGNSSCNCSGEEVMITVSRKLKRYTVHDLTPDMGYCIWVSANNTSGLGPINSNSLYHVVTRKDDNTIVIVVVFVFVAVVIVIALIFLFWCWCIPRIKSRCASLRKIEVPDIGELQVDLTPPVSVMGNSSGSYIKIEETKLDTMDKDSAICDDPAAPLLGYNSTQSIECDDESVKSQMSDLSQSDCQRESIDTEQDSDGKVYMTTEGCDEHVLIHPKVNPVATFSDTLNTVEDKINIPFGERTESSGVRSDTELTNHSIQAACTNTCEGSESQCEDKTNPNLSEISNPTVSLNSVELTYNNMHNTESDLKHNTVLDLNVELISDEESVLSDCFECNEGSLDGYTHIPLKVVSSDDEADCFDTNVPQDTGTETCLHHDKDHKLDFKPSLPECENSENESNLFSSIKSEGLDFNHDSNLNTSRSVKYDFINDLRTETSLNCFKTDCFNDTNKCSKSQSMSAHLESAEEDEDSDFGDVDLSRNDMTDILTNSVTNKRLSLTSKNSAGSVRSVGSDSAIDSMDSCRLEPQGDVNNERNKGLDKHKIPDEIVDCFIPVDNEKDLTVDTDELLKDKDREKINKWLGQTAGKVVIQEKHKVLPQDYSLAEHV